MNTVVKRQVVVTPEFVERWNHWSMAAGQSWRVDGTYVKIRGI
jgi:putative transposase